VEELSIIRSATNPAIQRVRRALAGKEEGLVLLEGERLIADAHSVGLEFELVLFGEQRAHELSQDALIGIAHRVVEDGLLGRVSGLKTSPGCLALARRPSTHSLGELALDADALLVVAAGVSDPGNLGALARTAEAAGARALCVVGGGAQPFGPKALRGSMGSLLRLPVVLAPSAQKLAEELTSCAVRQVSAATRGGCALGEFEWSGALALWVSSETGALPEAARDFEGVSIPMAGAVESLNVSAAAAVLLFAAAAARGARS